MLRGVWSGLLAELKSLGGMPFRMEVYLSSIQVVILFFSSFTKQQVVILILIEAMQLHRFRMPNAMILDGVSSFGSKVLSFVQVLDTGSCSLSSIFLCLFSSLFLVCNFNL